MAISGGDVKFTFTGDASDLNKELSKVSGNLDGVVSSSQGAANDLDRKLGPAAKSAGNRIEGMSEQSGDADSILQGLAASLDMVNPALGDAARFAGDAAGGFEAVGRATFLLNPAFLAAAAAAAAVALAFVEASAAAEEAEAAVEAAAAAAEKAQKSYGSFKDAIEETADAYRLQIGEVTELELAIRDATGAVEDQTRAGVLETSTAIVNMEKKLKAMEAERKGQRLNAEEIDNARAAERRLFLQIEKKKEQRKALEKQRDTAILQAEFTLRMAEEEEAASEEAAANEKARASAAATRAKEARAEAAAQAATDKEREAALVKLAAIQRTAGLELLTDREKITEQWQRQLEIVEELQRAEAATPEIVAEAEQAKAEIRMAAAEDLAAFDRKEAADRARAEQDKAKLAQEALETNHAQTLDATVALTDAVGVLTDDITDRQGEATGDAARNIFAINKAAALAGVIVNTATGVSKSMTLLPPANAINAAAVVAAGIAATAKIASAQPPAFHSGAAPDEINARLMQGEGVLNASAVGSIGGADGVNALNAGELMSSFMMPGGPIGLMFKHRLFDAVVKDNVKRTGSPLRKAIQGATLIGQTTR